MAEGTAALVNGRPRDAERLLSRLADPDDAVYNLMFRIVSLPDLVEASALRGHRASAEAQVAVIAGIHETWHAPVLEAALRYARLVLTDDSALDDVICRDRSSPPARPVPAGARPSAPRSAPETAATSGGQPAAAAPRAEPVRGVSRAEVGAARREELRASGERLPDAETVGRSRPHPAGASGR